MSTQPGSSSPLSSYIPPLLKTYLFLTKKKSPINQPIGLSLSPSVAPNSDPTSRMNFVSLFLFFSFFFFSFLFFSFLFFSFLFFSLSFLLSDFLNQHCPYTDKNEVIYSNQKCLFQKQKEVKCSGFSSLPSSPPPFLPSHLPSQHRAHAWESMTNLSSTLLLVFRTFLSPPPSTLTRKERGEEGVRQRKTRR